MATFDMSGQHVMNQVNAGNDVVLAQQILRWIQRTRKEMEQETETHAVDCLSALVDDIETLCKEKLRRQ